MCNRRTQNSSCISSCSSRSFALVAVATTVGAATVAGVAVVAPTVAVAVAAPAHEQWTGMRLVLIKRSLLWLPFWITMDGYEICLNQTTFTLVAFLDVKSILSFFNTLTPGQKSANMPAAI